MRVVLGPLPRDRLPILRLRREEVVTKPNKNPAVEAKKPSQDNITMAKRKRRNFLLPLLGLALIRYPNLCFPGSSLHPHAAAGGKTPPASAAGSQQRGPSSAPLVLLPPRYLTELSWLQLSKQLRGLQASRRIPLTTRSHLPTTCRELLSYTWLPRFPPISHSAPSLRANKLSLGTGEREPRAR